MSYCYWGITGYGLDVDDIYNYINHEKVNSLVRELMPNETFEEDVFEDDTFYGSPYQNFAEFLCELDDTHTIIWEDGGNSNKAYFLYVPKYPWMVKNNDPTSYKDVEDRIVNAVMKVCDADEEYVRSKIDSISDYGSG